MMTDGRVCTYGLWHIVEGGYAYNFWDEVMLVCWPMQE